MVVQRTFAREQVTARLPIHKEPQFRRVAVFLCPGFVFRACLSMLFPRSFLNSLLIWQYLILVSFVWQAMTLPLILASG